MSGFRFELGVFKAGFVPTSENIDQWAENWNPAQATFYNPETNRFAGKFTVTSNLAPFTAGTPAYIWGFRGSPQEAEWILFRKNNWKWPATSTTPSPVSNKDLSWVAEQADTVLLGDVQKSGKPYLMKADKVVNTRPPNTPWHVWVQEQQIESTTPEAPNQDTDKDGVSDLLEFVMGSNPKQHSGPPSTPVHIVPENSSKYLQITIPRRIDHTANLTVQVADNPAGPWLSGPDYTTEVSNGLDSLIVRDRVPISPDHPHRFMRLHVDLPQ